MSDTRFVRTMALGSFGDVADDSDGVRLRHLPPFTTLLIRTKNSLYRVVITRCPEVYVQGGVHFPDPTPAYLDGARTWGSGLKVGWIGVGRLLQFRSRNRCIITSPVRGIKIEQVSSTVVH